VGQLENRAREESLEKEGFKVSQGFKVKEVFKEKLGLLDMTVKTD
jgi:hypothetical protein